MKYLFCGLGSIGERHLTNLLSLGETDVIAFRRNNLPLRTVKKKIETFSDLKEALKQKPDVAFITNPSAFHIPLAIKLANAGCHLFIEKPLSDNLEDVSKLERIVKKKKLIVKVGFMMRYHPAMIQIKKWLEKNEIGYPVFARISWGEYLPAWHPWENYRKSYSAKKEMGGGPINTLCHDVDLVTWLFEQPKSVFAFIGRKSSLEISTEHSAEMLLKYKNKFIAEVHVDFLQLPPKRTWEIVGDKGRIEFDYYKNSLVAYKLNKEKVTYRKKFIDYSKTFDRNNMFIDELKEFVKAVKSQKQSSINLHDGINNLKILSAAHKSVKEARIVNI